MSLRCEPYLRIYLLSGRVYDCIDNTISKNVTKLKWYSHRHIITYYMLIIILNIISYYMPMGIAYKN